MHRSKDHVNGMTRLAFCGGAIKDSRQEAAYFGMSIEGQKRRFSPSASLFRSAPTNGHRRAGPFGPVGAKRRHVFRPMISPEIAQNEGGEHVVAEREGRQLSSLL